MTKRRKNFLYQKYLQLFTTDYQNLEKRGSKPKHYKKLRKKKWKIILADPPWKYNDVKTGGSHKSGSAQQYKTMTKNEICNTGKHLRLADNCYLFLWTTYPMIPDAIEVIHAWGFKFRTVAFTWVKKTVNGKDVYGMGRRTRGNPEIVLLGIRGKPKPISKSIANLTYAEVGKHSEKPQIFYEKIEKLCGKLPRLEMFARKRRKGWESWGLGLRR